MKRQAGSPATTPSSISRKSLDNLDNASTPDFLFKMLSISLADKPSFSIKKVTIAGSISPERVPMIRPASGVNPIEVSTDLPPSTAQTLAPFPKWQTITFVSSSGLPSISAAF